MKTKLTLFILITMWFTACGPQDDDSLVGNDPETDVYRQALVSPDDVKMEYAEDGTATNALNGQRASLGLMTANAVISTHLILGAHLLLMRAVANHEPTGRYLNKRVWEVTEDDLFVRLTIEKSDTPRGTRFEYSWDAKRGDGDMLRLVDGDVVRIETRPAELGGQGFGTVRFFLTNLNTINPEEHPSTGTVRAVFRKVGNVKQVRVNIIDHVDPNDASAPRFAAYGYTLLPDRSGALKWFSIGDAAGDGAPYENVAVHSVWRDDKSGIANAFAFGGSLDVDYWNVGQCWDSKFFLAYQVLATPDATLTDGEIADCFEQPEALEVPEYEETLPDEDPQMPEAHEAEEG